MRWGEVTFEDLIAGLREMDSLREPEFLSAHMTQEEYQAQFPRVRWVRGWSDYFYGTEIGVYWSRVPYEGARETDALYRRYFLLEIRWRPLARAMREFLRLRRRFR